MKKNWRVVAIVAALNIVLGAISSVSAQQLPIAGGYAEASTSDPEVVSAASFAIRAEGRKIGARISLLSIERAEVQVVAGLNYRLHLKVKVNGRTQDATAVVYRNLRQTYSLSSWDVARNQAGRSVAAFSNSTIEQLVKALAEAYEAKELGRLDAGRPYFGTVRVVIAHSIVEDSDERRTFRTLAKAEQWLKSHEVSDGLPARGIRPLLQCKKGVCDYDFDGGILHNHLYLQQITYGFRRGRPYIKTIYLLDGD